VAEPKTKPTKASVAAFLDAIPEPQRRADCKAIAKMMEKAAKAKPVMWGPSIVGFGVLHLEYRSGGECDWPMIGFAPRKRELTLYLHCSCLQDKAAIRKLGKVKTSKACLYLKKLADVDPGVLKEMIDDSVARTRKMFRCD
jgi:uncharacterized protein DUF1801